MRRVSLDNPAVIKRYDHSGMINVIASFPEQCHDAIHIGLKAGIERSFLKSSYNNIVCTGLGGSAVGADIARSYIAAKARIPLFVNRDYTLPAFVSEKTLVVASSYSGNTEETLSAYKDAKRKGARVVAITSGGVLKKMAESDGFPVIVIPGGMQPRCAVGYSLFTLLGILSKLGIIKENPAETAEAIEVMRRLRDKILGPTVKGVSNVAKTIAGRIHGKFPVIYGSQVHLDAVVIRWRGQFAENAKTLASTHVFPEMCHNEIAGWQNPSFLSKVFAVIILRDTGEPMRLSRQIDLTKSILNRDGVSVTDVWSSGRGVLARIFSLAYIGDFVSYYLAILNRCDPTPVEKIAYLKKITASASYRCQRRCGKEGMR
ncbi:MAG: bifunctional phosphoglucose/phosphomannose isomerase [Candidatus Omnitrophica bacterium]|nr:bifunctional phosphoglucose/phosphomannose isomerase [Candidatus Omnitrophota bacterium]MCM8791079.1 bifunctional phosphoglucose/phosphomannose isomerase [Candidatus Omnitrophota bacterium]